MLNFDWTHDTDTPLKMYLREIGEEPMITVQEENNLARRIKKGAAADAELRKLKASLKGKKPTKEDSAKLKALDACGRDGKEARAKMIRANLRLVVKIAQDYANYGLPLLDLISEGNIGLMKSVDRFDPSKGAKLSTYAAWWIKQSIKRALANQGKTIRLPIHLTDKAARLRRLTGQLSEELGREPTDDELADEMHTSPLKISLLRAATVRPISLNLMIGDDDESELGELIADPSAISPDDIFEKEDVLREMLRFMNMLHERERLILTLRYGLGGHSSMTLEDVGKKFKITRERIRQLQNISLRKLKRAMEKKEASGMQSAPQSQQPVTLRTQKKKRAKA